MQQNEKKKHDAKIIIRTSQYACIFQCASHIFISFKLEQVGNIKLY